MGTVKPIGPEEIVWCGAEDGLAIQPGRDAKGGAAGWNGRNHSMLDKHISKNSYKTYFQNQRYNMFTQLTPWAPIGRKPPTFGMDPIKGLIAGEEAQAPGPQLWSQNRVFMSGFCLGLLQRWCCQFKLWQA